MALTKITQGVIKPGENFDTHNINSTGIITATAFVGDGSNLTGLADPSVLTYSGTTKVEAVSTGATVTGSLGVAGNITATGNVSAFSFSGDGSGITGVSGFATALSTDQTSPLSVIFKTPKQLTVGSGVSITVASDTTSGNIAFMRESVISIGGTLHVGSGTTLRTNVLNLF